MANVFKEETFDEELFRDESQKKVDKTTAHIYRLIKEGKLDSQEIDGVKFVTIKTTT